MEHPPLPNLSEIDGPWILRSIIDANRGRPVQERTGVRVSLHTSFKDEHGSVTVDRELMLTPEEVLDVIERRKA